jgi:PAS domain S-box-containing protein
VSNLQDLDMWLVDTLAVPASLHGPDGRFVHLNAAGEQASGKSNAELRGRHFTELLPLEVRDQVEAQFRRAAVDGEPTDFETAFIDGSGSLRGVRAQHLPLRSGEAIVGVLILAFDVDQTPFPIGESEPRLTPRQREVLDLIASGLSTSEIAKKLTLSTETVRNHVRSVLRELHVHTRLEAIAAARRRGLLAQPALKPLPAAGARDVLHEP